MDDYFSTMEQEGGREGVSEGKSQIIVFTQFWVLSNLCPAFGMARGQLAKYTDFIMNGIHKLWLFKPLGHISVRSRKGVNRFYLFQT